MVGGELAYVTALGSAPCPAAACHSNQGTPRRRAMAALGATSLRPGIGSDVGHEDPEEALYLRGALRLYVCPPGPRIVRTMAATKAYASQSSGYRKRGRSAMIRLPPLSIGALAIHYYKQEG